MIRELDTEPDLPTNKHSAWRYTPSARAFVFVCLVVLLPLLGAYAVHSWLRSIETPLLGSGRPVTAVAISHDAEHGAVATADGRIHVYGQAGRSLATISVSKSATSIALLPSGRDVAVVAALSDATLRHWSIRSGAVPVETLLFPTAADTAASSEAAYAGFSIAAGGQLIAYVSGAAGTQGAVFSASTLQRTGRFEIKAQPVASAGARLGLSDGSIVAVGPAGRTQVEQSGTNTRRASTRQIAVAPATQTGKTAEVVISIASDGTAARHDGAGFVCEACVTIGEVDGGRLVAVERSGRILLYPRLEIARPAPRVVVLENLGIIDAATVTTTGMVVAALSHQDETQFAPLAHHNGGIVAIDLRPFLVNGLRASLRVVVPLSGAGVPITHFAISNSGKLIYATADGKVRLADLGRANDVHAVALTRFHIDHVRPVIVTYVEPVFDAVRTGIRTAIEAQIGAIKRQ